VGSLGRALSRTAERTEAKRPPPRTSTLAGLIALAFIASAALAQPIQPRAAHNLTGKWQMVDVVESSALPQFEGLRLGFQVFLHQQGNEISGTGEKWTENGRQLPPGARSLIMIEGSVSGDLLDATFTEVGARRSTTGILRLRIKEKGNRLEGRFACTAADSRGQSTATKAR